jgi:hypothetical protein
MQAYQSRRYARIAYEEVAVWRPRDSDESSHLVSGSHWAQPRGLRQEAGGVDRQAGVSLEVGRGIMKGGGGRWCSEGAGRSAQGGGGG